MDRRPNSRLRKAALWLTGLIVLTGLLFLSVQPAVPRQARPSAQDIQAARTLWAQLKAAKGAQTASRIDIDDPMLQGLSSLMSDATGLSHLQAGLEDGEMTGAVSIDLPLGLWLNARGMVSGRQQGFPTYRLTVGRITFPATMSRWMAEAGRWGINLMGANIPPLDMLVREIDVRERRASVRLALPAESDVFDSLMSVRTQGLDQERIAQIYCRTIADTNKRPVRRLDQLLARSFSGAGSQDAAGYNRAAFVALSLIVVGEKAYPLVPGAAALIKKCPAAAAPPVTLQGRDDLAKHWTFSAALAAALGEDVADNLGEWKELDDSLDGGSGFSFVDLAADRAGVRAALLSSASSTAEAMQQRLKNAHDDDLLPAQLLQAPEGLSEDFFQARFGNLQAGTYRRALAYIDRTLAEKAYGAPAAPATSD